MRKILFLPSWYPSCVDLFNGDFIERHAKCISLTNQVYVIYVVKDPLIKDGKWKIDKKVSQNLITYTGYYPAKRKRSLFAKIDAYFYYTKLHKHIFRMIRNEFGKPDVIHLNVMMKAGLIALWLKRKYRLPYVISEHWTGFDPRRNDGYHQMNVLYKYFSRRIFRQCDWLLPVSEDLGKKMNQIFGEKKFTVIPNVVDTQSFYYIPKLKQDKIKFIHVSSLGYQKNARGILNSVAQLFDRRKDFELQLIGPAPNELVEWTKNRGLFNNGIFFTGEIAYEKVAAHLQKCDCLIMFSRYENLPCVILEALCCGLPVISTDVGGIREVINDENGILIPSENEEALLKAMEYIIVNHDQFDSEKIGLAAQKRFNYQAVAKQFNDIYSQLGNKKNQ